jgi:hypothetical protein
VGAARRSAARPDEARFEIVEVFAAARKALPVVTQRSTSSMTSSSFIVLPFPGAERAAAQRDCTRAC